MYILKCEVFDGELSGTKNNVCCVGDCHDDGLIPVTPYALEATPQNKRLDWQIGIQALVCCGRYEFVRSLSREWWVRKGREVGLWNDGDVSRLLHQGSWHSSMDRRGGTNESISVAGGGKVSTRKVASGAGKCPGCGSKWTGDVCDNCGHGGGI